MNSQRGPSHGPQCRKEPPERQAKNGARVLGEGEETGGIVQDVPPARRAWDSVLRGMGSTLTTYRWHVLPPNPGTSCPVFTLAAPLLFLWALFLQGSLGLTVPEGTRALAPCDRGSVCTLGGEGLWMDQGVSWNLSRGTWRAVASPGCHEVCSIILAVSCLVLQLFLPPHKKAKFRRGGCAQEGPTPYSSILGRAHQER